MNEEITPDGVAGGVLEFRFEPGGFDMKVLETQPAERVLWEVVDRHPDQLGLADRGRLHDRHVRPPGWREPVEFMHHCSTKWATFLMSLKSLLGKGAGAPAPYDVKISDRH